MNKEIFKKELTETVWLVTSYASDYYKIKSIREIFKKKDFSDSKFQYKCHEGFKKAQSKIVTNILFIEDEIIIAREELLKIIKGKKKRELKYDGNYHKMKDIINNLTLQKNAFQEAANVIVWTILNMQRTHVKSFMQKDGGGGYLKDRDIKTVLEIADDINRKENEFALISDITSCIHMGDLIIVRKGNIEIVEVKKSGKLNDLVEKVALKYFDDGKIDNSNIRNIHEKSKKHGLKQLKRYLMQIFKISEALKYINTDKGYDWGSKQQKTAINIVTPDEYNRSVLIRNIENFYKIDRKDYFFILDCLIIGLFKNEKDNKSEIASSLDFKHQVYHILEKSWEDCQYGHIKEADVASKDFKFEMAEYGVYEIYSLRSLINIPTHIPIFLLLPSDQAIDLITRETSIYIFLNIDLFLKKCKNARLPLKLKNRKETQKIVGQELTENLYPTFNNKYLLLESKKLKMVVAYGILFRLIYELQTSNSLIRQLKENVLQENWPNIYKLTKQFYNVKVLVRKLLFKYF